MTGFTIKVSKIHVETNLNSLQNYFMCNFNIQFFCLVFLVYYQFRAKIFFSSRNFPYTTDEFEQTCGSIYDVPFKFCFEIHACLG